MRALVRDSWVSVRANRDAEPVRRFGMNTPDPDAAEDFTQTVNPDSLQVLAGCQFEPSLANAQAGDKFQFERQGYFCVDPDSKDGKLVFNRSVSLKDTWAKIEKKG